MNTITNVKTDTALDIKNTNTMTIIGNKQTYTIIGITIMEAIRDLI